MSVHGQRRSNHLWLVKQKCPKGKHMSRILIFPVKKMKVGWAKERRDDEFKDFSTETLKRRRGEEGKAKSTEEYLKSNLNNITFYFLPAISRSKITFFLSFDMNVLFPYTMQITRVLQLWQDHKQPQLHPSSIKTSISTDFLFWWREKIGPGKGLKQGTGEEIQLFTLWPTTIIYLDVALLPFIWKENLQHG